jgi:hypothetical protein
MRAFKTLLATGIVAVASMAFAAQAPAFPTVHVTHPSDPSWADIASDHQHYAVCDAQADGHYTWLRIDEWGANPNDWYSSPRDSYGRDRNGQFCVHTRIGGFYWIRQVQICVSYEGCTPWRRIT